MTLTEFLLARIDEDAEKAYRQAMLVLRDHTAKRAIIAIHEGWRDPCIRDDSRDDWPCLTMKHLATVYDWHPDYQPEWRPE